MRFGLGACGAAALAALMTASPRRSAASCGRGADGFDGWLQQFKQEAASQGISRSVIESALSNVSYDEDVISHDRGQRAFGQSFATFSSRHITAYGIKKGRNLLKRYAEPLQTIEQRYGVPGAVLIAIWGLETGYGSATGKYDTMSALATLAYDCRRTRKIPRRADRRPEDRPARRSFARRDARRLGRRDRADPVHAFVLSQIRARRSHPQSRRRALLDRQLPARPWLAARRGLGRGPGRISPLCSSGTPPPSTPRRSACSPTS